MNKYEVNVEWAGYSRGGAIYVVEAENEEEAKEIYDTGEEISRHTARDDTESEPYEVKLIS